MFADPELYRTLRQEIVPSLKTWPICRVWHSGFNSPAEVYATAILLLEEGLLDRATLYATDTSQDAIEAAQSGVLKLWDPLASAQRYQESGGRATLEEYFKVNQERIYVKEALRKAIVWSQHDPQNGASFNEFQLIICAPSEGGGFSQPIPEVLHQSLCRFGVLVLPRGTRLGAHAFLARYETPWHNSRILRRAW